MDITLNSPQTFPAGTTVKAYPATNWQAGQPKEGAPKGAAAGEAVVAANGDIALTGLTEGLSYYAVAEVGGIYRYVQFLPEEPKSAEQEVGAAGEAGKVLAADDAFNPDGTLKGANLPVSVVSGSEDGTAAAAALIASGVGQVLCLTEEDLTKARPTGFAAIEWFIAFGVEGSPENLAEDDRVFRALA